MKLSLKFYGKRQNVPRLDNDIRIRQELLTTKPRGIDENY